MEQYPGKGEKKKNTSKGITFSSFPKTFHRMYRSISILPGNTEEFQSIVGNNRWSYLGFHKFSGYFSSWWFQHKFLKFRNFPPVEVIGKVKCLRIFALYPLAPFTGVLDIGCYASFHIFDPVSENTPQTNGSFILECIYLVVTRHLEYPLVNLRSEDAEYTAILGTRTAIFHGT